VNKINSFADTGEKLEDSSQYTHGPRRADRRGDGPEELLDKGLRYAALMNRMGQEYLLFFR
jgi:hypothetical protein